MVCLSFERNIKSVYWNSDITIHVLLLNYLCRLVDMSNNKAMRSFKMETEEEEYETVTFIQMKIQTVMPVYD